MSRIAHDDTVVLFFVHVFVGTIEYLVEPNTVAPFRNTDTEAHRKAVETARLVPLIQESVYPIYYGGGTGRIGIRQHD